MYCRVEEKYGIWQCCGHRDMKGFFCWGNINALWFLHKPSTNITLTKGSRGWMHADLYTTELLQLGSWMDFSPWMCCRAQFSPEHTYACWTSPIKMQTEVTLQQKSHSKQETYQTACWDKVKGGVFSAAINNRDLNTTSLWSQCQCLLMFYPAPQGQSL